MADHSQKTVLVAGMPKASHASAAAQQFSLKSRIIASTLVIVLLVAGFGGWAASAKLASAVIAQGSVVVARNVKKVQHSEGGIVAAIKISNGDRVKAGDVLVTLDDTQVRSALGVVNSRLAELSCRRARLAAERDDLKTISFPTANGALSPALASIMAGERRVFQDNQQIRQSQKQQLRLRIEQFKAEISGLQAQRSSKARELTSVLREFKKFQRLQTRKLVIESRVNAMEREVERIKGRLGDLVSQIARAQGRISEVRLQILNVDQEVRTASQRELRSIEANLSELNERRTAAHDRLQRMELHAPISGIVHQLAVHTIGGVVSPAEPLLLIVPEQEQLTIEVRFAPTDIDQVKIGLPAKIRFSAFNQNTTPELTGHISYIAADVSREAKSGLSYYLGRLDLNANELQKIGNRMLLPGMPVEVFITTKQRTALSYLTKPFRDQLQRTFREE